MGEPFETDIKKHTEALAADPKSRAFVPLSDIYRKMGRYDEAITVAKEGVAAHPHYMGGKVALGRAYFENGELDSAECLLAEVLNFANDNLIANRLLAQVYLQKNEKERALPLLKQLADLELNDAWVAKQLATYETPAPAVPQVPTPVEATAQRKTEPAKVVDPSTSAPKAAGSPLQTATLAELYRSQGHPERALNIYRLLLRTDPMNREWGQAVTQLEKDMAGRRQGSDQSLARNRDVLDRILVRVQERRRSVA